MLEFSVFGKILETFKHIVPKTSRVATIFNPDNRIAERYQRQIESAAAVLGIESFAAHIHGLRDIERTIEKIVEQPNGGLIFPPNVTVTALRDEVVRAAARHRVPAAYTDRILW